MNFILFKLYCVFILGYAPDQKIPVSELTFVHSSAIEDTNFYESNMEDLMDQEGAYTLVLKMATCPRSHTGYPDFDAMPLLGGYQHVVAVAVDDKGNMLTMGAKAALPCPPHCGSKLFMTLADFLSKH